MSQILFLKFNNYFNKDLKVLKTYEEYLPYVTNEVTIDFRNFNPADGVDTEIIVNTTTNYPISDYVLIIDDQYNMSRWFIVDFIKVRGFQFRAILKRDVLADNYEDIKTAPLYIKRAQLENSDPYIFNKEPVDFNKIKVREELLQDSSKKAWIVGYIAPDTLFEDDLDLTTIPWTGKNTVFKIPTTAASTFPSELNQYLDVILADSNSQISMLYNVIQGSTVNNSVFKKDKITIKGTGKPRSQNYPYARSKNLLNVFNILTNISDTDFRRLNEYYLSDTVFNINGRYKHLTRIEIADYSPFKQYLENNADVDFESGYDESKTWSSENVYVYRLVDSIQPNVSYYLLGNTRTEGSKKYFEFDNLQDAPYAMFYMEYDEINVALMSQLATKLGSNLYDLQLLPFKPTTTSQIYWTLNGGFDGSETRVINFALTSKFEKEIPISIIPDENYKVDYICNLYRIVSPNFSNDYEFSPAMNDGVDNFHVNCTYKPYTPVINVHPNYKGLYGQDFDDNRGLTLGGDFSLPIVTDQWVEYQIQNKNFENSFNRQQSYQKKMNKLGLIEQGAGSLSSALTTGIGVGVLSGNPIAGVATGATSGILGGVDLGITNYKNKQALRLNADMFRMNNENIQARPEALSKTDAFNINNKIFPFVEVYTCTDTELNAFKSYLEYKGMTVERLGTLDAFKEGYFEAEPIKLYIDGDSHTAAEIVSVLTQGIYIKEVY